MEVLSQNGFMDYSLYLTIVIKPFKEVDFRKNFIRNLRDFDATEGQLTQKNKLLIAQIDPELLESGEFEEVLLLKE